MSDVRSHRNGTLSSPVRNRYFYGKLLDVTQLEREQKYFVERSRLINRLTLGTGVVCGLSVWARDGEVVVGPGVAVDGLGREIVVTEPFVVPDPWTLTDECGEPTDERRANGPVVLCLAYHECLVDPAPVLVSDCEIREACEHGAVRERYRVLVHAPDAVELPPEPCWFERPDGDTEVVEAAPVREVGRRPDLASLGALGPIETAARARGEELVRVAIREELGARPAGPASGLRERLCERIRLSCEPGPHCVPIALLTRDGDDSIVVDRCALRTTIYSNAVLLDLILCLAQQMEACCGRRVTVTAPVITATFPATTEQVKLAQLRATTELDEGGIAISFSRAMDQDRLEAPAEWLRVVALVRPTPTGDIDVSDVGPSAGSTPAIPVPLELARLEQSALDGGDGWTAFYRFLPIRPPGSTQDEDLFALLGQLDVDFVRFLVVARSDDVTQIVDADDPPELLDADYAGTKLSPSMLDLFWDLAAFLPALSAALVSSIELPAGESPPPLPSGNGIEGGIFHSYFDVTG
jgi:hypothetical protein